MKNTPSNLYAITVLGNDRPGIVADVTKTLFQIGCNIEDSSMTLLRSEFAMLLLVALPAKYSIDALESEFQSSINKLGLSVFIRKLTNKEMKKEKSRGKPYIISVYGADRPGIVYGISSILSKNKINITDVQTNIINSKKNKVYVMFLEIDMANNKYKSIKNKLRQAAKRLKVSVNINSADSPEL